MGDFLKASLNEHMLAKQICSTDYINYSKVVHRLMKQDSSKSSEKLMAEILGEPEYPVHQTANNRFLKESCYLLGNNISMGTLRQESCDSCLSFIFWVNI